MKKTFITGDSKQTRKLGELLAGELRGSEIICLMGELGSGKTTFSQGVLKGLGAKGPYTSPSFLVMKHYKKEFSIFNFQFSNNSQISKSKKQKKYKIPDTKYKILNIYHIDAYRVGSKDVLDLGWEEIVTGESNVVIVEWAERIRRIIPKNAIWIKFRHKGGKEREIMIC
ncbi:MAG: tRNA (adenosine(37)-N6)-threonylcarbamoyltransferase complex ATPase subunit type 1 TsaE [Candidatus Moranbacteria bacterium]|nr:tRNA (adenosine(37)-N6)-threonylcarbamoyltransferase complex ATPase subunit type 1 TsaE [Candidatus Moranbacteria bacterium]